MVSQGSVAHKIKIFEQAQTEVSSRENQPFVPSNVAHVVNKINKHEQNSSHGKKGERTQRIFKITKFQEKPHGISKVTEYEEKPQGISKVTECEERPQGTSKITEYGSKLDEDEEWSEVEHDRSIKRHSSKSSKGEKEDLMTEKVQVLRELLKGAPSG